MLCRLAARAFPPVVRPWASIAIGILVFAIWIAPDVLIPGYRMLPAFSNSVMGKLHSSLKPAELQSSWILFWRTLRAVAIVPIVEELFWRAWLMRWLILPEFQKVRLGTYAPLAFWVTAMLFASEHGPYWDVGLVTGIIYNLWMIRTRSVADCILMHAVTNGSSERLRDCNFTVAVLAVDLLPLLSLRNDKGDSRPQIGEIHSPTYALPFGLARCRFSENRDCSSLAFYELLQRSLSDRHHSAFLGFFSCH